MRQTPLDSPLHMQYKLQLTEFNKILKQLILSAKKSYYENEFRKYSNDVRNTWKTIKSAIHNSSSQKTFPVFVTKENLHITNPQDIVNEFNFFY